MRRRYALAGLLMSLGAAPAQAAPAPCLTTPEATALVLVALPEIIRDTGAVCAASLPPESIVRRVDGAFVARYDAEANRAWPAAQGAITKLTDPMATVLLQSQYARPLLTTVIAPLIVGRLAPKDCPLIDRIVTDLAPLPPSNTADIVVATLQHLKEEKARGKAVKAPDLPLCTDPAQ